MIQRRRCPTAFRTGSPPPALPTSGPEIYAIRFPSGDQADEAGADFGSERTESLPLEGSTAIKRLFVQDSRLPPAVTRISFLDDAKETKSGYRNTSYSGINGSTGPPSTGTEINFSPSAAMDSE